MALTVSSKVKCFNVQFNCNKQRQITITKDGKCNVVVTLPDDCFCLVSTYITLRAVYDLLLEGQKPSSQTTVNIVFDPTILKYKYGVLDAVLNTIKFSSKVSVSVLLPNFNHLKDAIERILILDGQPEVLYYACMTNKITKNLIKTEIKKLLDLVNYIYNQLPYF